MAEFNKDIKQIIMEEFNKYTKQMSEALSRGININQSNNQEPKQTITNEQQIQSVLFNPELIFKFEYPSFDAITIAVESVLTQNSDDYQKIDFMKKIKSLYNNVKQNKEYQNLMVFAYKTNPHLMVNKELLININHLLKNDEFQQELFKQFHQDKEYIYKFTTELGYHLNHDELTKLNQINDVLNDENINHRIFVASELFKTQEFEPLLHYLQFNPNYDSNFFKQMKKGIEHYLFQEETDKLTFVDNYNQMIKNIQSLYTKEEQISFLTNMAEKIETTIENHINEQTYDVLQLILTFNQIKTDLSQDVYADKSDLIGEANKNITKHFAQATSTIIKNTDNSLLPFNHIRLAIATFANVDGFIDNDILKKAISYSGYVPSNDKYNIGQNIYPLAEILDMGIKIDDEIKDFAIAVNGVNGAIIGLSNLSEQQKQQLLKNNDLIGNVNLLAYDTLISNTSLRKHANEFLDELKNHPEFVTQLLKTSPYNLQYIQLTKAQFDELAYDILATNINMIPQLHQGKDNVYFSNIGEFMFDKNKQSRVFNDEFTEKMNDVIAEKIKNNVPTNTHSGKWNNMHFQYLNYINDNLLNVLLDTNALSRVAQAQEHPNEDDLIQLTHSLNFNEHQQMKIVERDKNNFIAIANPTDELIIHMLDLDKNLVLKNHNSTKILSSILDDDKNPSFDSVTGKLIATIEKDWKFGKELVETLHEFENTDLLEAVYQGIIQNEPTSKHKKIIKELCQEDGIFDGWGYDEYYDQTYKPKQKSTTKHKM